MEEIVTAIRSAHPGIKITGVRCRTNSEIAHVQVEDKEHALTGAGSADGMELALKKAYSEFIERATMRSVFYDSPSGRTSSGFACHTNFELSASNSMAEIIERDAILCTWLASIPPYWLSSEEIVELQLPHWFPKSEKFLKERGIAVKIGILATTGNHCTVIASLLPIEGNTTFGCLVETSSNTNLSKAVCSALLGLMRLATCLLNRIDTGKIFRVLNPHEIKTVIDHMEFYLNPVNFPKWFFESSSSVTSLEHPPIEIHDIRPVANPFDLKVTRASCEKFQQFFVGTGRGQINQQRLRENFSGYNASKLNTMPHPIV